MKLIILGILLVCAAKSQQEKLVTPDFFVPKNPKIVGGVDTNIENVPYQVSLRYCNPETNACGHFCGGSIINSNTILSAAHCVMGDDPETLWIRAGSELRSQGGQVIPVRTFIIHPDYIPRVLYNDVAILKLKSNLVFSNKVMPIGLPPRGIKIPAGTDLLVSGWGALEWRGSSPERLQSVHVPYVPNEVCNNIYDDIIPGKICAGRAGVDACQGDSGGPLIYKNFVVGIVSGGSYCAYEGYPGTYARTSEYLDFIARAMAM